MFLNESCFFLTMTEYIPLKRLREAEDSLYRALEQGDSSQTAVLVDRLSSALSGWIGSTKSILDGIEKSLQGLESPETQSLIIDEILPEYRAIISEYEGLLGKIETYQQKHNLQK